MMGYITHITHVVTYDIVQDVSSRANFIIQFGQVLYALP